MRLYLVRHGHAQPEEVDPKRNLSEEGCHEAQTLATILKPHNLEVDAIWHSGKPRAAQTAAILATGVRTRHGLAARADLGPLDPVSPFISVLETFAKDLMIVGHLPFLGRLAALLLAGNETLDLVTFEPCSLALLEHDQEGHWRLRWLLTPEIVQ